MFVASFTRSKIERGIDPRQKSSYSLQCAATEPSDAARHTIREKGQQGVVRKKTKDT